jgi:valine--pyruvate aminotransferase
MLINMFCGQTNGVQKKLLHPIVPDYTGYSSLGIESGIHVAIEPEREITGTHSFKYHPDWKSFKIDETIGAVLFSRPTNPSGNVFSDEETTRIVQEAKKHMVPVIIDSAYAPPIPGINFTPMQLIRDTNVIYVLSFSKCGLPGERISVVIADEKYVDALYTFKANISIHSSRFGQAIAQRALKSGKLEAAAQNVIRPFYQAKSKLVQKAISENWDDSIPYYIHQSEGTLFMWVWFKDLPITDQELYARCKEQMVMVCPGNQFFFGQAEPTKHNNECIRISFTASDEDLVEGIKKIGYVLKKVYA